MIAVTNFGCKTAWLTFLLCSWFVIEKEWPKDCECRTASVFHLCNCRTKTCPGGHQISNQLLYVQCNQFLLTMAPSCPFRILLVWQLNLASALVCNETPFMFNGSCRVLKAKELMDLRGSKAKNVDALHCRVDRWVLNPVIHKQSVFQFLP